MSAGQKEKIQWARDLAYKSFLARKAAAAAAELFRFIVPKAMTRQEENGWYAQPLMLLVLMLLVLMLLVLVLLVLMG